MSFCRRCSHFSILNRRSGRLLNLPCLTFHRCLLSRSDFISPSALITPFPSFLSRCAFQPRPKSIMSLPAIPTPSLPISLQSASFERIAIETKKRKNLRSANHNTYSGTAMALSIRNPRASYTTFNAISDCGFHGSGVFMYHFVGEIIEWTER